LYDVDLYDLPPEAPTGMLFSIRCGESSSRELAETPVQNPTERHRSRHNRAAPSRFSSDGAVISFHSARRNLRVSLTSQNGLSSIHHVIISEFHVGEQTVMLCHHMNSCRLASVIRLGPVCASAQTVKDVELFLEISINEILLLE
jgi:hypothetical protein